MLFRLLVGLLVINIPTLHATDSNKPDDADTQAVATQGQPLGNATVCGAPDQFVTVIIFGDSQDTVCSVSYTNKANAPDDGICNKSAFPPGCRTFLGGLVLSIGRWAQKTYNPMVEQVLDNLGLSDLTSVGGLFLDVADGSIIEHLPFLQSLQAISDTGLQVLGSPTLDGLPGLVHLTSIDGHVFLVQTGMTNLGSLAAVSTIGRSMVLIGNHNMTGLTGMSRLSSIGGPLMVADNSKLRNMTGLERLVAVGLDPTASGFTGMSLTRNGQLTDLQGLASLVSIGGPLSIMDNPRLTSLNGLQTLSTVNALGQALSGVLHVAYNWRLQDISALSGLARCSGPMSRREAYYPKITVEVYPQRHMTQRTGSAPHNLAPAPSSSPLVPAHVLTPGLQPPATATPATARPPTAQRTVQGAPAPAPRQAAEVEPQVHIAGALPPGAAAPTPAAQAASAPGPDLPAGTGGRIPAAWAAPAPAPYLPAHRSRKRAGRRKGHAPKLAPAPVTGAAVGAPEELPTGMPGTASKVRAAAGSAAAATGALPDAEGTPVEESGETPQQTVLSSRDSNPARLSDGEAALSNAGDQSGGPAGEQSGPKDVSAPPLGKLPEKLGGEQSEAGEHSAGLSRQASEEPVEPGEQPVKQVQEASPVPAEASAAPASMAQASSQQAPPSGSGEAGSVEGAQGGNSEGAQAGTTGGTLAGDNGGAAAGDDGAPHAGDNGGAQAGHTGGAQGVGSGGAQAGNNGGAQAGNNPGTQGGPLQRTLQTILPQLPLGNIGAGLAGLGSGFHFPFQFSTMKNGSANGNVTYEQLANALAAQKGNWSALAPMLATSNNHSATDRERAVHAWVNAPHTGIPAGFLDMSGDPSSNPRFLQIVGKPEEVDIDPSSARLSPYIESFTRSPGTDPHIWSSRPYRATQAPQPDMGLGMFDQAGSMPGMSSMVTQRISEMPTGDLTLDLFIEQPSTGGDGAAPAQLVGGAPGPAPSASDLVVYRCVLQTWDDICRYIAEPQSVEEGSEWIRKGTCGQVFPALPGAAPISGPRI